MWSLRRSPLVENGSEPLSFRKVVYRIQSNAVLGDIYVNRKRDDEMRWTVARTQSISFNVAVTDGLRTLGYNVRDEADSLFDPKEHVKVRYEMAAILHEAKVNFYYKGNRNRDRRGEGIGTAEVEGRSPAPRFRREADGLFAHLQWPRHRPGNETQSNGRRRRERHPQDDGRP